MEETVKMEDAPGYFASCTSKEILEDSSFTLMEVKLENSCKDNGVVYDSDATNSSLGDLSLSIG